MIGRTTGRTKAPHVAARRWAVGVGVACAAAGGIVAGTPGLVGASVGAVIVVAFLSSGRLPLLLTEWARLPASAGLGVLLLTYTFRLALALLALALLTRVESVDSRWLGGTIVACGLTWTLAHVAAVLVGTWRVRSDGSKHP